MSRATSSPLPDLGQLPSDFIDHLVLITQSLANTKPPAGLRRALKEAATRRTHKASRSAAASAEANAAAAAAAADAADDEEGSDYETADGHVTGAASPPAALAAAEISQAAANGDASAAHPTITTSSVDNSAVDSDDDEDGIVTLPLPRFHFENGDARTQQIERNIGKLVERLWRAEEDIEELMLAQLSVEPHFHKVAPSASSRSLADNAAASAGGSGIARSAPDGGPTQDSSAAAAAVAAAVAAGALPTDNEGSRNGAGSSSATPTGEAGGAPFSLPNFPYPLSHAHPQSTKYPLSYPLGMGRDGPVLLTPAAREGGSESAVGAFEKYSDESGLSAQEELRLLKAQVQDIARVCKVSVRNRACSSSY